MPLMNRYVIRRILTLFPAGLLVLTAIIWSTQALNRLDLVTAKGQTVAVFLELTLLTVPYLATLLAPIAFVIAMVAVYDTLNRDSELVVLASAGAGRLRLLAPAVAAATVCAAVVAIGTLWLAPAGLAKARVMITQVRADVISSIVQPGRFIEIERDLTVHIRDRRADGTLAGLLLDDARQDDVAMTYLAETGRVVETDGNTLLVMTDGSIQRMARPQDELTVVAFDAYGFDLTDLAAGPTTTRFRPSERTVPELLANASDETRAAQNAARERIEIHDRLSQPIAPIVYAIVVFLFVGDPRMHRQSRFAGIVMAGVCVAAIRSGTYAILLASESAPNLVFLVYPVLIGTGGLALLAIGTDRTVTVHERVVEGLMNALERRLPARAATAGASAR